LNNNTNKVTIITGSSRGIGKAIAMEFAKAGYNIVINARDEDELNKSRSNILTVTRNSIEVLSVPGDVSQEDICVELNSTVDVRVPTISKKIKVMVEIMLLYVIPFTCCSLSLILQTSYFHRFIERDNL
jgi:short-subunit dehydrogenase